MNNKIDATVMANSTIDFLKKSNIELDSAQLNIMQQLLTLAQQLSKKSKRIKLSRRSRKQTVKGLYIWGKVGRGKTYLMDIFFNTLETNRKKRLHFQHFMRDIHGAIFKFSGQKNPLNKIAEELAEEVDIICLDELYIDDIADAMLLEGLFKALYNRGMIFVITSNLPPERLDCNGVNISCLTQAIEQLNTHNHIVCLNGDKDYRLTVKPTNPVFFFGDNNITIQKISNYFQGMSNDNNHVSGPIQINDRNMICKGMKDGIIWFDFSELCEKPRSQYDYIYIAKNFHTLLVSNIPQLDDHSPKDRLRATFNNNRARRFISLVDEMYDRSINIIASFEKDLSEIYLGDEFRFQFNRTCSRLNEMQTKDYMSKPHRL